MELECDPHNALCVPSGVTGESSAAAAAAEAVAGEAAREAAAVPG